MRIKLMQEIKHINMTWSTGNLVNRNKPISKWRAGDISQVPRFN